MGATIQLLGQLQEEQFYGAVTVKFEAGKIVHIKLERNIKPSDLSDLPRSPNAAHQ